MWPFTKKKNTIPVSNYKGGTNPYVTEDTKNTIVIPAPSPVQRSYVRKPPASNSSNLRNTNRNLAPVNSGSDTPSYNSGPDLLYTIITAEIVADIASSSSYDSGSSYDNSSSSSDFSGGGGSFGGGGSSGDW